MATKDLRQRLVRAGLLLLAAVFRVLPWRLVLGLGWLLGRTAHALQPRRRRRAAGGLARALGADADPARIRALVRGVFTGLGMNLAEILWVAGEPSRCRRIVTIDGAEHLREALAAGHGAMVITGHLGSWELLAANIVALGCPLSVIAREAKDGRVNEFLVGLRARLGVRTVLRGSARAGREILRALRGGGALGALIDQDIDADGTFVDFFGRPAFTPIGPVSLAIRSGAPVVLASAVRLPDGRHRLRFDPPRELRPGSDRPAAIERYTAEFTRWIEDRVREQPDQWVWIHRRWRRSPPAD